MSLRQKIINRAQKAASNKVITIGEGEDSFKVEVRSPTLAASLDFTSDSEVPLERFKSMLKAIIACSYDPDTGERVFDATDGDLFMDLPATEVQGLMEPIIGAITELINGARDAAKN